MLKLKNKSMLPVVGTLVEYFIASISNLISKFIYHLNQHL